ncbi:MAG: Ig-like domain-containing protein [Patescibacteria group bacterium]
MRTGAILASAVVVIVFLHGLPVHAQLSQAVQNSQQVTQAAGVATGNDLITIIGRIIYIFLGFLGIVFLVLMLYAGYLWMTSGGNPEQVKKATATIRNAVIGLVIIASAWAITAFILGFFAGGAGGLGGIISNNPPSGGLVGAAGSLGGGIIESTLPQRNATGVPRNTPIIITFKQPISPASFIDGWTTATSNTAMGLNASNIKIFRTDAGEPGALGASDARVRITSDLRTIVIKPVQYLGSSTVNVPYTVELKGGANGIKLQDGTAAFAGSYGDGYTWPFEVSTIVDLTPPKVVSAIPQEGGQYARNIVIQINFNEAVDPTATTGKVSDGFSNIQVLSGPAGNANTTPVPGTFSISNQYQTVEFISDSPCGTNSCGRTVYCLPGSQTVQVNAKAATLDPTAIPQAQLTSNGYDGVVDVAGNSLDGNGDGTGQGPPIDSYQWSFGTTNDIKLTPPQIQSTVPPADPSSGGNSNVPVDQPVTVNFDSLLQSSTLNTDNAKIDAHGPGEKDPDTFWWSTGMQLLDANGAPLNTGATGTPAIATKAALIIFHRTYLPSGTGSLQTLNLYDPYVESGIQDAYQNCFNPAATCGPGTGNPNCCKDNPTNAACKTILNP